MKHLATAVCLAVFAPGLASADTADCFVAVQDAVVLDGPCTFTQFDGDGSFSLTDGVGNVFRVFMEGKGRASGDWAPARGQWAPFTQFSALQRENACWSNGAVRICAW